PVVKGARHTKWQMLFYTLLLLPLTILPSVLGFADWIYGGLAIVLSSFFILSAILVLRSDDLKYARAMFKYSIFYLFALFLALMLCHSALL
ncbi:MAG TPA: protoheme IX farnesyltransferase, partial [Alphaproteobacteria bacterium]|nr:protoheme IX farnesyltransferase [Alphaproteobacteria bacterium]